MYFSKIVLVAFLYYARLLELDAGPVHVDAPVKCVPLFEGADPLPLTPPLPLLTLLLLLLPPHLHHPLPHPPLLLLGEGVDAVDAPPLLHHLLDRCQHASDLLRLALICLLKIFEIDFYFSFQGLQGGEEMIKAAMLS